MIDHKTDSFRSRRLRHPSIRAKCVAVCTDGAATLTGSNKGLRGLIQKLVPHMVFNHSMIHRQALVAKIWMKSCTTYYETLLVRLTTLNATVLTAVSFQYFAMKWAQRMRDYCYTPKSNGSHGSPKNFSPQKGSQSKKVWAPLDSAMQCVVVDRYVDGSSKYTSQGQQLVAETHIFVHCRTATAGSDVVQSGRPILDDFFQHLWPYIANNTANVIFQMVKRLWLIRLDQ
ncbi:hypothetical protein TNCV_4177921 [Trichonephila clavipes]|nr:hypothetical protein TNCV_4177921 [Trichonephila clavipes]